MGVLKTKDLIAKMREAMHIHVRREKTSKSSNFQVASSADDSTEKNYVRGRKLCPEIRANQNPR